MLERDQVMAAVRVVLDESRAGRGTSLFVLGDAGLGKSTVLEQTALLAGDDAAVGAGRADPMETLLPFGLLLQAIEELGGASVLSMASEVHIDGGVTRTAQFYRVRQWLQDRGGQPREPVLFLLDDLHWADADSLALLAFLCRRITQLPVGIVGTLRSWPAEAHHMVSGLAASGSATIEVLAPLSEAAAQAFLADRVGPAAAGSTVTDVWLACGGNPLLLEQTAAAIERGESMAALGKGLATAQQLLLTRFAGLSGPAMRLARVASIFGASFRPELAAEVAELAPGETDAAFDALWRSRLFRAHRDTAMEFVHPLFRQALYEDLGIPVAARLHAHAFRVLVSRGLEAEAADHAIRGDMIGDAGAVAVLERVGRNALRTGALRTATVVLEAARRLAGDLSGVELRLDLAESLVLGGRSAEAIDACETILRTPALLTVTKARTLVILGRALIYQGAYRAGATRFDESVTLTEHQDPALAVETLIAHALAGWFFIGPVEALRVTERTRKIAQLCAPSDRLRAESAWALMALETGDARGLEQGARAARAVEDDPLAVAADVSNPWGTLITYGSAAKYVERLADSEHFFRVALKAAQQNGRPDEEAAAAVGCIDTLIRRLRLRDAMALVERTADLRDLVPLAEPFAAVGRALVLLLMGHLDQSEEWASRADPVVMVLGAWSPSLWLGYLRGWRRLLEGDFGAACDLYDQIQETSGRAGVGEPCEVPWANHAITAYIGCGRTGDAVRLITWLDESAERLPCRWPRIASASGRARMAEADGDQTRADELFRSALALHDHVDLPLERLQTLLDYGRFLRRSGQPARARPHLAEALRLAEPAGAKWLAGLARAEHRAAGGRIRRRDDHPGRLTSQEQRVADLAATGSSNAKIARQLYLSISTVETHLDRVYVKLGIHSRRDLIIARQTGEASARPLEQTEGHHPAARKHDPRLGD